MLPPIVVAVADAVVVAAAAYRFSFSAWRESIIYLHSLLLL